MLFWLVLAYLFIRGGMFISKAFVNNFPVDSYRESESNITINNYTTEQHLHITENQLQEFTNKK